MSLWNVTPRDSDLAQLLRLRLQHESAPPLDMAPELRRRSRWHHQPLPCRAPQLSIQDQLPNHLPTRCRKHRTMPWSFGRGNPTHDLTRGSKGVAGKGGFSETIRGNRDQGRRCFISAKFSRRLQEQPAQIQLVTTTRSWTTFQRIRTRSVLDRPATSVRLRQVSIYQQGKNRGEKKTA